MTENQNDPLRLSASAGESEPEFQSAADCSMSNCGETLFRGSRFIRWTLSPFVLLFVFVMPIAIQEWTPARIAIVAGIELMCVALLAGLWLPARFGHWAFRGLAGLVFIAYAAYLVFEFAYTDAPVTISGRRSQASPLNALVGFVVIGLPGLWYAVLGRFTLRASVPQPEDDEFDAAAEDDAA